MDLLEFKTNVGVPSAEKKCVPDLASFEVGGRLKQLFLPGGVMTAAALSAFSADGSDLAISVAS